VTHLRSGLQIGMGLTPDQGVWCWWGVWCPCFFCGFREDLLTLCGFLSLFQSCRLFRCMCAFLHFNSAFMQEFHHLGQKIEQQQGHLLILW